MIIWAVDLLLASIISKEWKFYIIFNKNLQVYFNLSLIHNFAALQREALLDV